MNADRAFIAPFAKVERAKAQIQELELAIKSFFDATPYQVVRNLNIEANEEIWGFRIPTDIPPAISVMVGELFHNLRYSLDQMIAEIVVRISKRSEARVEFPFGRDFGEFETALLKQKKLPVDATTMIRALQPYQGGDRPIIASEDGVFGVPDEGMEFLTATPGTKFKTDFQPSFDIALHDVGPLETESVIYVASNLRDLVERILLTFEGRFFP